MLNIREMKTITTMRDHFTPSRIGIIKEGEIKSVGKDVFLVGMKVVQPLWEILGQFLKK